MKKSLYYYNPYINRDGFVIKSQVLGKIYVQYKPMVEKNLQRIALKCAYFVLQGT